ncbi:MAG TPA: diacylglycerol kinase family protein [Chryseolinea sp.]
MDLTEKKILFIVNKHAGIGYASDLEHTINSACKKNHATCSIEFTQRKGHAIDLSKEARRNGFNQVIAVGGDGTINEVARGLIQSDMPMGIVPRGSGNGLARHLGIPLKITDAVDQIFDSRTLPIDIFRVNGKLSLNVSGIGFDGHITNLFGVKSSRGLIGYVMLTIQEFLKFKEFETEIVMNGESIKRNAFIIAIANSSQYGNNARIAPSASVCDGLLHINVVKRIPLFRLDFLYSFFSGQLDKSSLCEFMETTSLKIRTTKPMYYHVDGEPCGLSDSFDIELVPAALQVLVPSKIPNRETL